MTDNQRGQQILAMTKAEFSYAIALMDRVRGWSDQAPH